MYLLYTYVFVCTFQKFVAIGPLLKFILLSNYNILKSTVYNSQHANLGIFSSQFFNLTTLGSL